MQPDDFFARHRLQIGARAALVLPMFVAAVVAQETRPKISGDQPFPNEELTERLDAAAERAFAWLATVQQRDGSFPSDVTGQPGVTSLVALAYMAWGHAPGIGPEGERLAKSLKFIAAMQRESGLISLVAPRGALQRETVKYAYSVPAVYNHAISALTLSEAYGTADAGEIDNLQTVIEKALAASLEMQSWERGPGNQGGWRYLHTADSDLSVSGWELMFLRSAKNAGFEVPDENIDAAVQFVTRCYSPEFRTFEYDIKPSDRRTRAMAAAGILALAHAGMHNRPEAKQAADWILGHGFEQYNRPLVLNRQYLGDRYHYGVFYCSQAMYQMGGRYWQEFFPPTANVLLENQNADGSWNGEANQDIRFGRAYTTALALLALGSPNQLLPVFQR